MRILVSGLAVAAVFAATPCTAQDWLGGLARGVAESAAQRLAERAVTAVTSGGTASSATPRASGPGGRPEMYNAEGDRIYRSRYGNRPYDNQAVWRTAARCAALERLVDVHIADWQARMKRGGGEYRQSDIDLDHAKAASNIRQFREFALLRLGIDRAGQDVETLFDREMEDQVVALRQQSWTPEMTWDREQNHCTNFYSGQSGLIYDMTNRRGEGSNPAPAR
ncbi:MAG: hypothetical protein EON90_09210 [Brevundimonas sp.]|nr:MAG: hypothetical protein EON90_09210 [Brevundimonas sp.]